MSIKTGIATLTAAALVATASIASTTSAEAHGFHPGWGFGAGLVGAAVVGSAIAAATTPYPYTYQRCGWVRQYDAFGRYIGAVNTCY